MAIKDRNLTVGTRLVAKYKKKSYTAEVVERGDGKLRYHLEDGREFKSPSAAGSAVMGGNACNGWNFWSVEEEASTAADSQQVAPTEAPGEEGASESLDEAEEVAPDAEVELAPAKRRVFRVPNQHGVSEGETRHYCHDCGKSFTLPSEETPQACPQGHSAEN